LSFEHYRMDGKAENKATATMQYCRLGRTGMKVSRICLGMMTYGPKTWRKWVVTEEDCQPILDRAWELGITFYDTADMYSLGESERILGRFIKKLEQKHNVKRSEVVIATKLYHPLDPNEPTGKKNDRGLSRKHIFDSIEGSLKRLGMDYVDLYQIHRFDKDTPVEETMEALHDLVKMGKVRYLGASSMYTWQFAKLQHAAELRGFTKFVSMQNHYNLVYREEEREMNPFCVDSGVGLIPWSPLARGFLAGNRSASDKPSAAASAPAASPAAAASTEVKASPATARAKEDAFAFQLYYEPQDFLIVERVKEIAKSKNKTPAQISLAWILQRPNVNAPIVGASRLQQLEELVDALSIQLSPEEINTLEEPYKAKKIAGHS